MATVTPGAPEAPSQAASLAPPPFPSSPAGVVYDPAPAINAVEHGLKDWLNKPVEDVLSELGLDPRDPHPADAAANAAGAGMGGPGGGLVAGMMAPLVGMLGMVGNGLTQGLNPQQMFQPVMQAFQQGAQSLQGLMGQLGQGGGGGG
ncbi:hypothetical protein E2F47_27565, partial [Mycobacterium eburneum]